MPRYIRSIVPGATYFFTVVLAERESDLLIRQIDRLRMAYAQVVQRRPFETVAIAVLPDHLHAIWRLPEHDADYAGRWQQIKKAFSVGLAAAATRSGSVVAKREKGIWQRRYWEHQIRDEADLVAHTSTSTSTR